MKMKKVPKPRKSPIKFANTKAPKMGAGSSELKAVQKMYGITKPAKINKMKKVEKARKNNVKSKVTPF